MKKLLALCVALALVALGSAPAWAWTIQDGADHLYNPTITGPVTLNETTNTELLTQTCAGWGLTTPVGAWSCSGDTITRTASASDLTITNAAAVAGTVYKVCATYATITAGTFSVTVGGVSQVTHGTAGQFCEYIPAATTGNVTITAVAASAGTITVSATSAKALTNVIQPSAGPIVMTKTLANATANEAAVTIISNQTGAGGDKASLRVVSIGSGTGTEYIQEWYAATNQRASIDVNGNLSMAGSGSFTGGAMMQSALNPTVTYMRIDSLNADTAGAPASGDCDSSSEVGRLVLSTRYSATAEYRLWACVQTAASTYTWYRTDLTAP